MKRERPQDHNHSNGLFSHHHNPHHLFPPPPHLRHAHSSEENDSREADSPSSFRPPPPHTTDGSSIEIVRRPRGRPPGSKNKPKPSPMAAADPPEPPMGPYVLELPPGVDVIESTARFCRHRNVGLCILNGHGAVSSVSLRQPSATPAAAATFHGRFDILSVSATILPAGGLPSGNGAFTVFLSGPQGQVVGGLVVGPLVSAGTVYLIAATFNGPTFLRLAAPDHDDDAAARDSGGGYDRHESPHGGDSGSGGGGAPIYSYQPSDVIWAPTARQAAPPPQPPPY